MHFSRSTRAGLVLALLCLFSPNSFSSDSRLSGERTTFARPSFADATAALVRTSPTKSQAAQTPERDGNDEEDVPLTRPKKRTFRSLSLPNHRRNKRVKQVLQWGALGLAVLALAASAGFAARPEAPKAALEVQRVRKTAAETRRKGAQQKDKQVQTVEQKGLFRSFERSFIDTVKKPALNVRRTVDDTVYQVSKTIHNLRTAPEAEIQSLLIKLREKLPSANPMTLAQNALALAGLGFAAYALYANKHSWNPPSLEEIKQNLDKI